MFPVLPFLLALADIGLSKSDDTAELIPKQHKKERLTIRMERETSTEVDNLASEPNLSWSEFIVQCVGFAMKHMPPKE